MSSKLGRISKLISEYAEKNGCFNRFDKTTFLDENGRLIKLKEVVVSKPPVQIIIFDSKKGNVGLKENEDE